MIDRRRVITRVCSRLRKENGFIGKAGMLRRRAEDDFFLLVHFRQFMAPIAGSFYEALLWPRGHVPAIEIMVGIHAREMYLSQNIGVPRVEELRSTPFLPNIHVLGPPVDEDVTGAFLATDSLDERDMLRRVLAAVDEADAAFGSRERVVATWRRMEGLPGIDADSAALCAAFVLGLNGDLAGGEAIISAWIPRLEGADLVAWFEESRVRLRALAGADPR